MSYLNDHWTNEIHLLGRKSFALSIRKLIMESETPFALSISGRWGAGKTSMLRTLMQSLGGKPLAARSGLSDDALDSLETKLHQDLEPDKTKLKHIKTVWFNPWQYQNEPNPIIPLLHEIQEQVRFHFKTLAENEAEAIKHITEAGLHSLGNLIDNAANLFMQRKVVDVGTHFSQNLEKIKTKHREDAFAEPVDAQRFFLQFEKAIARVAGGQKDGRLVVFIDDLDRCADETVFALLEAIKLYLSSRHCVFVFGLDVGHVESAIARAAKFTHREAAQYLEKLFQVRLHLPAPTQTELTDFLAHHLLSLDMHELKTPDNKLILKYLREYLPVNPRVIKTVLNGLKLYADLMQAQGKEAFEWDKLILVHLFRTFYQDAYELLVQDTALTLEALNELNKEKRPNPNDPLKCYLHRITENPLYSGRLAKETEQVSDYTGMTDELFRQIRAGAWQAKTLDEFLRTFLETFTRPETLADYLL